MRARGTWAFAAAAVLALGCGNKDDAAGEADPAADQAGSAKATTGDNPLPAEAVEPDRPAEAAPPAPAKPAIPTPADFSADKAVPAQNLKAALDVWKRKTELTVAGYTKFFIGDKGALRSSVELVATAGGDKDTPVLARCDLAGEYADEVTNKTPLVVKGTLRGTWGRADDKVLWLEKCEVTGRDQAIDENGAADPTSGEPIFVQSLHDTYFGWIGKEVAVVGYYKGLTTSTNKGRILDVRIDISDNDLNKVLGCHLEKKEVPEDYRKKLEAAREGTIFRGVIAEEVFGTWQLEPCRVTNR